MTRSAGHPQTETREATIDGLLRDWEALMRRSSTAHTPEFLAIDVTMSQAKLLHVVATEPEASMSSLAGRLGVSLSTLSGVVDRLVEHGLLDRREDASDRRQVIIALTTEGRSVIERFRELGSRHFRSLLVLLDDDELNGLARGVSAMATRGERGSTGRPSDPTRAPDAARATTASPSAATALERTPA